MKKTLATALGAATLAATVITAPLASASPQDDFGQCLKTNGVSVELPKTPPPPPKDGAGGPSADKAPPAPPGVKASTWQKAWSACWKLAPKPPR